MLNKYQGSRPAAQPNGDLRLSRQRQPTFTVDGTGRRIASVPLAGGQVAILDEADCLRLRDMGISTNWVFNQDGKLTKNGKVRRYVRVASANNLLMVARLILNVPQCQRVRYLDWNPLNLRQANLYTAAKLTQAPEPK